MSIRNIEDIGLDEITEDSLREDRDDLADEFDVDSRQGSLYYDATEGHVLRTAKFFSDLRQIAEIISLDTCTGDVLDEWLRLKGMARNPSEATPATYEVIWDGDNTPEVGEEVSCDDHMFTVQSLNNSLVIVSEETGTELNTLTQGLPVIPEIDVDGLISATLGELLEPALDIEDDETARERLFAALAGTNENANKAQLMAWCESVEGVGHARIVPLWNGANTAKGVIISTAGGVPSSSVVAAVQEYVDPDNDSDGEGDGVGEGMATIGLKFTAAAAIPVQMNVAATVSLTDGAVLATVTDKIKDALSEYFAALALSRSSDTVIVRMTRLGSIIASIEGVDDYESLTLNSGTSNLQCSITQIPIRGTVTITDADA